MRTDAFDMLVFGTHWETVTFFGPQTSLLELSQNGQELVTDVTARLISYIHHTNDYRPCCRVGSTVQHCPFGLFQDSGFAGNFEDSKSTSGAILCFFGSRTFVPKSWMCKKQTSVSIVLQIRKLFRWMLVCGWTYPCS